MTERKFVVNMLAMDPPPLPSARRPFSRLRATAWTLATMIAPLALSLLFTSIAISVWYVVTRHQGAPPNSVVMRATLIGTPIGLWTTVFLWWAIHRRAMSVSECFNLRPLPNWSDVGAGLALGFAWILLYHFGGVVPFQRMVDLDLAKLQSLPTSLSAGFCEEFLFRGFLLVVLGRAGAGNAVFVVVSALTFGLSHALWGPGGMAWTAVLGLTLAALVVWRKNVWPAVIAHTLIDLFIEPALIEQAFAQTA